MNQVEENQTVLFRPQVTPRTEPPVGSVGNSLESALHTSAHSTEEALPKRPGGKHCRGEPSGRGDLRGALPTCLQVFVLAQVACVGV